jgi:hypothetical protein
MLTPLQVIYPDKVKRQIICVHWRDFPPVGAGRGTPEELRASKTITEDEYSRMKIWERICGQVRMNRRKCPQCPHVRFVETHNESPCMVTTDGRLRTPLVDLPTMENLSRRKVVTVGKPQPPRKPPR